MIRCALCPGLRQCAGVTSRDGQMIMAFKERYSVALLNGALLYRSCIPSTYRVYQLQVSREPL